MKKLSLLDCAQIIGGISTPIAIIVAILSADMQIASTRDSQHEATAKETYREYLVHAFEHPEFSHPNFQTIQREPEKLEKYEWFVSILLLSSEQILTVRPMDAQWKSTIKKQLAYHQDYLHSERFTDHLLEDYDLEIQGIINDLKNSP